MFEAFTSFFRSMKEGYLADPIFHENEKQANKMMVYVLIISGFIMIAVWLGAALGIFVFARDLVNAAIMWGLGEIAVMCIIARYVDEDAWWLKYLLMAGSAFVYSRIDMIFTHKAALVMVIPVICSCRYFSRKLTISMAALCTVTFALSAAYGANHGLFNLNDLTLPIGTTMTTTGKFIDSAVEQVGYDKALFLRNTMIYSYMPKWLIFVVAAIISTKIASRGREMVLEEKRMTESDARIRTELGLAARIQADALPSHFPAFPDRVDLDIYASMNPAKEVGGDFYDFFLIDSNHLALVIADVSGKGIPAALFMMSSKSLVRNYAMAGQSPASVLTAVNRQTCENNQEDMFVTVWLGILDLRSGHLTAANAGHEYPILRQPDGPFELFMDPHSFVIGGLKEAVYKDYELDLKPGSKLFLYTDGVPEATDNYKELFGINRMLSALNKAPEASPEAILQNVRSAVNLFVRDSEQFDDLTMLCIEYKGDLDKT